MSDPIPPSGGPSGLTFEADLRATREAHGVSVEAIQHDTRIPADIIKRFESGSLIGDSYYNEVYLRAFLKQYAQAIGLPSQAVLDGYEAHKAGQYGGELRPGAEAVRPEPAPLFEPAPVERPAGFTVTSELVSPEPTPVEPAPTRPEAPPVKPAPVESQGTARTTDRLPAAAVPPKPPVIVPPSVEPASSARTPVAPLPRTARTSDPAPAVAALRETARDLPRPDPAPAPSPRRRVRPSGASGVAIDRAWGTVLGLAAAAVLAIAAVLFFLFRDEDRPEPEPELVAADTVQTDTARAARPAAPPGPRLADTIRVAVVAADGPLAAYRLQVEGDERRPYWLEQGSERTLESTTAVFVWGNWQRTDGETVTHTFGENATLRMQGFEWKPVGTAPLRIDRVRGQRILDSLHALRVGGAVPAAGDSTTTPPTPAP